jgi:6-pyruvoyltetrahydropterin/6-carboxytetrahydropterin synthase
MKAHLSRRYRFSASHRLHTEAYDLTRNREVFGKCNHPFGHGHNYIVQVTVSGRVDPTTGMVCDLVALDAFVQTHVLERFDHRNLNTLPCFADKVSTTENLTAEIYRSFQSFTAAHVERIHIEETSNNSFDFSDGATMPAGTL